MEAGNRGDAGSWDQEPGGSGGGWDSDPAGRPWGEEAEDGRSLSGGETRLGGPSSSSSFRSTAAVGQVIGERYELTELIGRGGMGVVFKARDQRLGRDVAVKFLLSPDIAGAAAVERFRREARSIAELNHVNIITVHDFDEGDQGPYLVMEHVAGKPLSQLINERGELAEADALRVFSGICRGAAHAHKKGVIHRDLKPSNVMLDAEGTPKLMDFGLARGLAGLELSLSGYGMGTLDYAAPEQKRDAKSVDHRADVYSLGATFYEILTGLKPVPLHLPKVPERWRGVIEKACEPMPEDRYDSVDSMLAALEQIADGSNGSRAAENPIGDDLRCPSCQVDNALEARFCRSCGGTLTATCPACREPYRVGLRHCDRCGANIEIVTEIRAIRQRVEQAKAAGRYGDAQRELATLGEILARRPRLGSIGDVERWRQREANNIAQLAEPRRTPPPPPPRQTGGGGQRSTRSQGGGAGDRQRQDLENRATTVLVMGILSFFICITAPVAWVLGRSLHKDCAKAGVAVPSRAAVGMWFGIVLSVILIIYLVCIMIAMMAQL